MRAKIALILCFLTTSVSPAHSVTTPKPTPKVTAPAKKLPPKSAVAKPLTSKKPVAKSTSTKKVIPKKRIVRKRKYVKVTPPPKPVWPPSASQGWVVDNKTSPDIYVRKKVPDVDLKASDLNQKYFFLSDFQKLVCTKYACTALQVASTYGCNWWEITSTVYGPISDSSTVLTVKGTLTTLTGATNPKQRATVYLISSELLNGSKLYQVKPIKVVCTRGTPPTNQNTQNYQSIDVPAPSPSASTS